MIFTQVTPSLALGMLGVSGSHALWGFNFVLPKDEKPEGKTIVVSAAAGSIGITVAQLAKNKGFRVVGGSDKCERLLSEFKLEAVVDYKMANNDLTIYSQLDRGRSMKKWASKKILQVENGLLKNLQVETLWTKVDPNKTVTQI